MTKLETNIANIEGNVDLGEFLQSDLDAVLNAAKSYAALQKLAPEIGALVEAGEKATEGEMVCKGSPFEVYNRCHGEFIREYIKQKNGCYFVCHIDENENADFIVSAYNSRPTLKAIHEILTKGGV